MRKVSFDEAIAIVEAQEKAERIAMIKAHRKAKYLRHLKKSK